MPIILSAPTPFQFIIAIALTHNPLLTIVTEEHDGSARKPKIPHICRQEELRSISLLQFIEGQNWRFGREPRHTTANLSASTPLSRHLYPPLFDAVAAAAAIPTSTFSSH